MEIVPVIDLKGGIVVRARHGDRKNYQPIQTPLSPTAEALDVVAGLLSLHPFRSLYVADLDAIEGGGDHRALLRKIARAFPEVELWIDNGCSEHDAAETLLAELSSASLVLGSESQRDCRLAGTLSTHPRAILSLDFREHGFIGPRELLERPDLWPQRIVLMSLSKVGSGAGPDFERLESLRTKAGARRIHLAGGLRDRGDLAAVAASGAAGVLVASALHDGRLTSADLAAL